MRQWAMRIVWALLVCFSLNAAADSSVPDKGKKKGSPPGASCKKNEDCDQSGAPQICIEKKCQINVPPPT